MGARARLEHWLDGIWYGGRRVPLALALLERVYALALAVRRRLYASGWRRSERVGVPVVVVGNVTAGGTGKTPLVAWLAQELVQRGWKPGIVLRGYGGSASGALLVDSATDPAVCGDEAALAVRATHVPVAVGAKRADAARLLAKRGDCDVIVADDGLQHWALARDVEIAVVDGERRSGNGRLLPAGPLREPESRLGAVDFVVCNGSARDGEIGMRVGGSRAVNLRDPARARELSAFAGTPVHAVAGIGNPERFFALLERAGLDVVRHALDDHHRYDGSELRHDGPVLVTEKDAVKCAPYAHDGVWVVPVQAELPAAFAQDVHAALHRARSPAVEETP